MRFRILLVIFCKFQGEYKTNRQNAQIEMHLRADKRRKNIAQIMGKYLKRHC